MANTNHFDKLFHQHRKVGELVELVPTQWNEWRIDKTQEIPDLSGLDFPGWNIRKIDNIDFSGAILTNTIFTGMTLEGINFNKADLRGANFSGVTFKNVDMTGARLSGARIDRHTIDKSFNFLDTFKRVDQVKGIRRGVNGIYSKDSDSAALMEHKPTGDSMVGTNISTIIDNLKQARKYQTVSFSLAFLFAVVRLIPNNDKGQSAQTDPCRKVEQQNIKVPFLSQEIPIDNLVPFSILVSVVMLFLTVLILHKVYESVQFINRREDAMAIGQFPWPLTSYARERLDVGLSFLIRLVMCFHPLIYWSKFSRDLSGPTKWSNLIVIVGGMLLTSIGAALFYTSQKFQRPVLFDPTQEKKQLTEMQQVTQVAREQTRSIQRLVSIIERSSLVTKQDIPETTRFELEGATPLVMVGIPSGQFLMGSPEDEYGRLANEGPQHQVKVECFQMCQHPVTQGQWKVVMGKDNLDKRLKGLKPSFRGDLLPMVMVSWNDSQEFIQKLNEILKLKDDYFSLPSEAQWEYAARAGTTSPFFFGDQINPAIVNYDGRYPYRDGEVGKYRGHPVAVGSLGIPNEWGLYDMHGNVLEWCQDEWHDDYSGGLAPTDGKAWTTGGDVNAALRVIRGGSWGYYAVGCRSAFRYWRSPGYREDGVGFRLSRTLPLALLPSSRD